MRRSLRNRSTYQGRGWNSDAVYRPILFVLQDENAAHVRLRRLTTQEGQRWTLDSARALFSADIRLVCARAEFRRRPQVQADVDGYKVGAVVQTGLSIYGCAVAGAVKAVKFQGH